MELDITINKLLINENKKFYLIILYYFGLSQIYIFLDELNLVDVVLEKMLPSIKYLEISKNLKIPTRSIASLFKEPITELERILNSEFSKHLLLFHFLKKKFNITITKINDLNTLYNTIIFDIDRFINYVSFYVTAIILYFNKLIFFFKLIFYPVIFPLNIIILYYVFIKIAPKYVSPYIAYNIFIIGYIVLFAYGGADIVLTLIDFIDLNLVVLINMFFLIWLNILLIRFFLLIFVNYILNISFMQLILMNFINKSSQIYSKFIIN